MRAVGLFRLAVAVLVVAACGPPAVWGASAVVQGTALLKVRRGPGPQHAAFGRLEEGQQVEVRKVDGAWANLRMPDGSDGWVHVQYLSFSRTAASRPAAPSPSPNPKTAASPTPSTAQLSDQSRMLLEENARLVAEVTALRHQLMESSTAAVPAAGGLAVPAPADLHADVQRLLRLTQEVRDLVGVKPEDGSEADGRTGSTHDSWLASNGWVLAVSVVVGGLIGSAYGRMQERRRRTRIRF